jgi:hypothetical protein
LSTLPSEHPACRAVGTPFAALFDRYPFEEASAGPLTEVGSRSRQGLFKGAKSMTSALPFRKTLASSAVALALASAVSGCGSDSTVGGLVNPNPGSVVDRDKSGARTDLPIPDENAGGKEPIADSAASQPATTGGASSGLKGEPGKDAAKGTPGTPATKENSGGASGDTKPPGPIKDGTPKSPQ